MKESRKKQVNALPGVRGPEGEADSGLLALPLEARAIGEKEIAKAAEILTRYKNGKRNLERRLIEDEQWYKLRHWEVMRGKAAGNEPEPASAWLFNTILNKHADAMDNFPEPAVLPREEGDVEDAKLLSSILPVVRERSGYEQTYSDGSWEKLKHGTAVYGVFWNKDLENGLGDIDIRGIDLLNVFWEPGTADIQRSRNLFIVDLVDRDLLESEYPQCRNMKPGDVIDVAKYVYDDNVDTTDKVVVVDWYYKLRAANGRTLVHYVKFAGNVLLFASENEEKYTERGWYEHGEYPVEFDTLFPEKGTPVGFGYVAVCKDPQLYIDKLSSCILKNAVVGATPRYWVSESAGVNEGEFLDIKKPLVHVAGGNVSEDKFRPIETPSLSGHHINVLQMKIDEMKETSANRDFTSGGTASGVTAAAAIAALQEAGNKTSRDSIAASYRADARISILCLELIRQFYTESRCFRITGDTSEGFEFVAYSNAGIQDQSLPSLVPGEPDMVRRPIFDIKIKAQKRNPYSQMVQNEQAKELYRIGAFAPERAQESMLMLDMMEFEGIDAVRERVKQGETLLALLQQAVAQRDQLAAAVTMLTGRNMLTGESGGVSAPPAAPPAGGTVAGAAAQAEKTNMTGFGQRLAKRSTPEMGKVFGDTGVKS